MQGINREEKLEIRESLSEKLFANENFSQSYCVCCSVKKDKKGGVDKLFLFCIIFFSLIFLEIWRCRERKRKLSNKWKLKIEKGEKNRRPFSLKPIHSTEFPSTQVCWIEIVFNYVLGGECGSLGGGNEVGEVGEGELHGWRRGGSNEIMCL